MLEEKHGLTIKRSTLYTRLLLRNSATHEEKRHYNTVPVRLKKPDNDLMKKHEDDHFAAASMKVLKDIAV